jgi:hypothetical protein
MRLPICVALIFRRKPREAACRRQLDIDRHSVGVKTRQPHQLRICVGMVLKWM